LAGVLVALYPKRDKSHVLLIKRSDRLKSHAGEIAFPGGMYQAEDGNLLQTALRETGEELRLDVPECLVVGQLSPVTTLTGFRITPFVAILPSVVHYQNDPDEVESVLEVPLAPLLATQQREAGRKLADEMYEFFFQQHRVWGATARILHQIAGLCQP
jgi:8-oxo-dGTP pyrophosphatase MutT (NUDIX family)